MIENLAGCRRFGEQSWQYFSVSKQNKLFVWKYELYFEQFWGAVSKYDFIFVGNKWREREKMGHWSKIFESRKSVRFFWFINNYCIFSHSLFFDKSSDSNLMREWNRQYAQIKLNTSKAAFYTLLGDVI